MRPKSRSSRSDLLSCEAELGAEVADEGVVTFAGERDAEPRDVEYFEGVDTVAIVAVVNPVIGGVIGMSTGWTRCIGLCPLEDMDGIAIPGWWRGCGDPPTVSYAALSCMLSVRGGGANAGASLVSANVTLTSRKFRLGSASNGGSSSEPSSRLRLFIERAELLRETGLDRGTVSHTDSFGSVAESCRFVLRRPSPSWPHP